MAHIKTPHAHPPKSPPMVPQTKYAVGELVLFKKLSMLSESSSKVLEVLLLFYLWLDNQPYF